MPQRSRRSSSGTGVTDTPEKTPNQSKQRRQYGKGTDTPGKNNARESPRSSQENAAPLDHNKDEIIRVALQEASTKYPGFISRDCFQGSIVEVESKERATGATLWMSEADMFTHSLSPGSAVAVSVAVSVNNFLANMFPLESLASLCSKHYNIELEDAMMDEVGTYFAVAIVWPSRKLIKNGVRLSRHLSCTMGNPSLDRTLYVFPLQIHSTSQLINRIVKMPTLKYDESCHVSLCKCNDLCLKWLIPKSAFTVSREISSPSTTSDNACNSGCENVQYLSPKTPSGYLSKLIPSADILGSRSPSVWSSTLSDSPQIQNSEGTLLHTNTVEGTFPLGFPNWASVRVALEDDKLKELLQKYSLRWLGARILLRGNFVTIPVCGQLCVFHVKDANIFSKQMYKLQHTSEVGNSCSFNSVVPEEVKHEFHSGQTLLVSTAFLVGHETNVHFLPPVNSMLNSQYKESLATSDLVNRSHEDIKEAKALPTSERLEVASLGGLLEEVASLKEIINFSLLQPHILARLGLQPTRGVLLYGPPGTGKTSLASACAFEAGVNMFPINGPEIVSEYYGESEQALHAVFKSAEHAAPSVVFIDELDAIAPARKDGSEELSQRMVAALLALIDGVNNHHRVLVIAATNRPESIDPALRRPGRLDREIEIGVPSPMQRLEILQVLLRRMNHSLANGDLQSLAANTHGFVGADITALCNEAAMSALRRYISNQSPCNHSENYDQRQCNTPVDRNLTSKDMKATQVSQHSEDSSGSVEFVSGLLSELSVSDNSNICHDDAQKHPGYCNTLAYACEVGSDKALEDITAGLMEPLLKLTMDDFEVARRKVRPSAMREVMLEVPKVRWCDIGGQGEVKQQLKEAVEWPQKHQHAFIRIGTHPPRGLLMFGPPGCSKTLMARAVASEAGLNFLAVKGPELFSKWVGESEKAVQSLFAKARAAAPSIIFFDEIDGLAVAREHSSGGVSVGDRVMSQLLVEMDGLNPRIDVTVIAATNRPDKIDAALLRPGRFDRLLYVGPPNEDDRKEIFNIHMKKMPCGSDLTNLELASLTNGYTGADISAVCREAAIAALEENLNIQEVSMRHFKVALARVPPSDFTDYESLSVRFQRHISSNALHGTVD
eukprot:Gb_01408 [translate_table: standard]